MIRYSLIRLSGFVRMKLRSNTVFQRGNPKISSTIKDEGFLNEKRLSLWSSKSNYGKRGASKAGSYENLGRGTKETLNVDGKVYILGLEAVVPIKDLVVSCPKDEIEEEEGNESVSIHLNEKLLDLKEEIKSTHIDCENGSKSLESETFADDTVIANGDDGSKSLESETFADNTVIFNGGDDKETSLNDPGNANILGKWKEKGRHVRKKKFVGKVKKIESNQEKIHVVLGVNGDDECVHMPLKHKRGRKRKNVEALGSKCNGRAKKEKVEKDVEALGSKCNGRAKKEKVEKDVEASGSKCNGRAKKEKVEKDVEASGSKCNDGPVAVVNGGLRVVVLGLKGLNEIPKKMLKRRGRPPKVLTEGENTRPKKKLKRRGRPCKLQGEITPLPLNEILRKKLKRRGRPLKVSHEIPAGAMKSCGIKQKLCGKGIAFKKFKRRGRPPKMEARTLATHVVKVRTVELMSVKKSPKIRKNEKSEENSEQLMVEGKFLNAGKGIIGGKLERKKLKQLIRDKISDILLKCGWTIDLRQRQEKSYKDAVYIEPKGKRSHWSITGAYAKLKQKIENGVADNNETSAFTPIPEEEINVLFRQRHKECKKKKNKILKNVKGKIVTNKKKKLGKKSKDGSKRKMIFKPRVLVSGSENGSKQDNEGVLVIKKRNLLSWMIDSGVIMAGTKVQYGKTRRQKRSSEGIITSDGICCGCCNEIMGITKFVGHCGGKFGQVFDNLYLESGTCLRKCLTDSWRKEEESNVNRFIVVDVQGDDPNDDTCNICGDGGNLICCDGCPSTFHQSCLDVQNFPSGDWNCIYCTCKFCGVVSVSSPDDAITSQMCSCCLCEEKFHQLCLQEGEDVNEDSNRLPFCGRKCQELFERLQTYLGVKHELEDGFSWTLLQRFDVDQDFNVHDTQLKVEQNSKLAIAFSVMDECFVPITDERSGTSIIRNVVYNCGSNFRRLNYAGFLTAVLEKDDEFITAASIRIHGYRLAEMPFIGTRHMYRRQGMCRRLLDAIESTLSSLGVEELIIPAIPALLQTWTNAFGFMPLGESKKQEMKCMSMMVFPGIDMLKKPLLQNMSADADTTLSAAGVGKDVAHERKEEMILLTDGCSIPEPNDENNPQFETASSNATDYQQTSADTAGIGKDIIDYKQTEKETVLMDCCSCPDLEDDKLTISRGVNSLCDLNLPVKNVLPCDTEGQTSADSGSFPDCTFEPSSLESAVCGNPESSELKLDVENDGVPEVKVKSPQLTSKLVLKNTFDLNLHPTAVETDVHVISDDSIQCETRACIKSFELSDSRSQLTPFCEPKVGLWQLDRLQYRMKRYKWLHVINNQPLPSRRFRRADFCRFCFCKLIFIYRVCRIIFVRLAYDGMTWFPESVIVLEPMKMQIYENIEAGNKDLHLKYAV
ncbi:hypothetical protein L1987_50499 [Smallanthus sonchifolius]|uniref:Uncharacterized protein n=1 Tax=Smallanthus sonchifolius TaxID=185202 RepID=A0ACB9EME1_9ASTR|nr:hypothetical protein L1987_50499 [Smallanthus sonchifolius]